MAINDLIGSSSASLDVQGKQGFLFKNAEQFITRELIGAGPVHIENGAGAGGSPVFSIAPTSLLGMAEVDCTVIGDQIIPLPDIVDALVTEIVFTRASAVPAAAFRAGVYSAAGKTGHVLSPPTVALNGLTSALKIVSQPVSLGERVEPANFFFSVEAANPSPLTLTVYVIGKVLAYPVA